MKKDLKAKLKLLNKYIGRGNTIVLSEDFFHTGKFYEDEEGIIQAENYLDGCLPKVVKYLSSKGITIEIGTSKPLTYIFSKK